jgi:hypothetical protein
MHSDPAASCVNAINSRTIRKQRILLAGSTLVLLTVARAADIATTLHFDPSLSHEGNPVVFLLGGGLFSLLFVNFAVWLLCATFVFAYWRGNSLGVRIQHKSFGAFVRAWIDRVVRPRRSLRSTLPGGQYWHEGLQAIRLVGLALAWAVIFGSATAVHAWFATYGETGGTQYQQLYSGFKIGGVNYFVWLTAPVGFAAGSALFFSAEFKESQRRMSDGRA